MKAVNLDRLISRPALCSYVLAVAFFADVEGNGVLLAVVSAIICLAAPRAEDKPVSYHKDIKPLFTATCNGCHRPEKSKGELDMTTHAALMKGGKHGVPVVPGEPRKSKLLEMISGPEPEMPDEGDPLKPEQVEARRAVDQRGRQGRHARPRHRQGRAADVYGAAGDLVAGVLAGRDAAGGQRVPRDRAAQGGRLGDRRPAGGRGAADRVDRVHQGRQVPRRGGRVAGGVRRGADLGPGEKGTGQRRTS